MSREKRRFYQFGEFLADTEERQLFRDGEEIALTPKVFDTLQVFLENGGRTLAKAELMEWLWADSFVEEANLTQNVSTLRKALGENPNQHRFIVTVPGRGYRFVAPIRELPDEETDVVIRERAQASIVIEEDDETAPPLELQNKKRGSNDRRIWLPVGIGFLLVLAIFLLVFWLGSRQAASRFEHFKPSRITATGKVKRASVSPDGRYVVYAVAEGAQQSLWLRQLATGSNIQIVAPQPRGYIGLTFSRDGEYLYFVAGEEKVPSKLVRLPTFGGSEMKLLEDADSPAALSPDEKQIAFLRGLPDAKETTLVIADIDGANERRLASLPNPDTFVLFTNLIWTKEGKILCAIKKGQSAEFAEVDANDGGIKPIGAQKWNQIGRAVLSSDGKTLIFTATDSDGAPLQILQMPFPNGRAKNITNDLSNYQDVSLTMDDKFLVTLESEQQSNISVAPASDLNQMKQITGTNYDGVGGLAFAPDGKIVYTAATNGLSDIWIADADGEHAKQLTFNAGNNQNPAVSPDGKFIAFASTRTGESEIWLMEIDGSRPRQLTTGGKNSFPRWSPDGRSIFYQSRVQDIPNIFKIPAQGGAPARLTDKISGRPAISPDGNWIAILYREEALKPPQLAIIPASGGNPARLINIQRAAALFNWTADGQAVTFISTRGAVSNIWQQPIDGGEPKQLTDFTAEQIYWFDWSPDYSRLAIARGAAKSDAVLFQAAP